MSLLGSGARSDTALNVHGCAVAHCSPDGAATAIFHVRLPGAPGAALGVFLQRLVASPKWQHDVREKGRLTVDDTSAGVAVSAHGLLSSDGLLLIACTRQDYPTRVVFPSSSMSRVGMLSQLSDIADDLLGVDTFVATGKGAPGTVKRVPTTERLTSAFERLCADYEDKGSHDSVSRVQREVDEARGVMEGTLNSMLANQDQLTSLQGKTDEIAGASKGFFTEARKTRRQMQCEEYRNKLCIYAGAVLLFLFFFHGWIFGDGDDGNGGYKLHIPPSPPPPGDGVEW